jgi:molybdate transport system substrate-binding protein
MLRKLLALLIVNSSLAVAADPPPLVAAASNLAPALTEIADRFERSAGVRVKLSYSSSGNIARQILQGAPFHLFISADKKNLDRLRENGRPLLRETAFARGAIGFFIPSDSRLAGAGELHDIIKAIEFNHYRRLAIANPAHAPYGIAAEQALESAGVWIIDRNKLLLGENIAQAVQFTLSGAVDIGIIPTSSAIIPEVTRKGRFIPIPETWHQPILQYLALLSDSNASAVRFYDYLLTDDAINILMKFGYNPGQARNDEG